MTYVTQQARIKFETLQTSSPSAAISALPASGARTFLRALGALALICALAIAVSIGLDAGDRTLPSVSGYLWEDRDDTGETGGELQMAGMNWQKRDIGADAIDEIQVAGYLWENRDDNRVDISTTA